MKSVTSRIRRAGTALRWFYMPMAGIRVALLLRRWPRPSAASASCKTGSVLVDCYDDLTYMLPALAVAEILRDRTSARDMVFLATRSRYSLLFHLLRHAPRYSQTIRADQVAAAQVAYATSISERMRHECRTLEDFLDLSWHGVRVGQHAYESVLRSGRATAALNDEHLWQSLRTSIAYGSAWEQILSAFGAKGVIVSHDCYESLGPLVDVACAKEVDCFWVHDEGMSRTGGKEGLWSELIGRYKLILDSLPTKLRTQVREAGRAELSRRVSAFNSQAVETPDQGKATVEENYHRQDEAFGVIALHDFIDNPHQYGRIWFPDYWHWARFVASVTRSSKMPWYLRTHPGLGPRSASHQAALALLKEFPHLRLVSPEESWQSLVNRGLTRVATYSGTVGHELPLFDVQVVLATPNPHIGFSFAQTATTRSEYAELILQGGPNGGSGGATKMPLRELEEFWGMHYRFRHIQYLFFSPDEATTPLRQLSWGSKERLLLRAFASRAEELESLTTTVDRFLGSDDRHLNVTHQSD